MSRYIDADNLIDTIGAMIGYGTTPTDIWDMVNSAPTIDIVRCKECKHNYSKALNHGKMQPRCDFTDWKLSENDYCSRGERREP